MSPSSLLPLFPAGGAPAGTALPPQDEILLIPFPSTPGTPKELEKEQCQGSGVSWSKAQNKRQKGPRRKWLSTPSLRNLLQGLCPQSPGTFTPTCLLWPQPAGPQTDLLSRAADAIRVCSLHICIWPQANQSQYLSWCLGTPRKPMAGAPFLST